MLKKLGRQTLELVKPPIIIASAGVVGKKEGEGPLRDEFDVVFDDSRLGKDSWEQAESALQKAAVEKAIEKSGKAKEKIDLLFAGDLLSQCIGTTFGIRDLGIPFAGLYGACSTMALSLAMASVFVASGGADLAVAATSSHFCSAEKQFRQPLEYGGQRPPQAQWTATAAGSAVVGKEGKGVCVERICFGKICDLGITDANNMGAAMAPAAADTIATLLKESGTGVEDYDLFVTGDLGAIGSKLLTEVLQKDYGVDLGNRHKDCGTMLFDIDSQDVNSGASGCGCSAAVVCTHFMRRLREKELKRLVFVGTGALMSPVSSQQGESIPAVAHAVVLGGEGCC